MYRQLEQDYARNRDVVFFHVQTVFEGFESNTPKSGESDARTYELESPVGYDLRVDGAPMSQFMTRFGTAGTPWTVVIDKKGFVRVNQITPDLASMRTVIDGLLTEKRR